MHEYGLAEGVLATVRQRADGRKVAGSGSGSASGTPSTPNPWPRRSAS